MSGPVAPINTELIPLIPPTQKNDLIDFFFLEFLKNKYQIIKIPISGLRISNLISFAD